ncbi:UDP-glucose:Glyco protein glucosyltransferase-domain-containing protein [Neohortaea acidophila]|uniref:UDP-glucose:Glyco protein glucosyltransferase-domain-containing protein n=1 Tax=Neohortaea acidophila TaxID=245834 RepID=A0A6A6Q613_9PEZI|nr:UDP-glucose:Glyco protein glucosyltransferase-domain-containing protein [Neohortaea acidophila]KAF2487073.1 UDP-glucose:Glyco protein glucosyltransferase-domain-containing protein [Neohortaea acidophila]
MIRPPNTGAILRAGLVLGLVLGARAIPSVNVALRTSFGAPPFLLELLETAAEENATSYFPLLDRIADGYFDGTSTDQELYTKFRGLLQEDGHLSKAEDVSSFDFALSIHSVAPRIEAHHQYYNTSVHPSLGGVEEDGCESWVYTPFTGERHCSPEFDASTSWSKPGSRLNTLPFDRVLGNPESEQASVLYGDINSASFRQFHKTISKTAKEGKTSYRIRYKPSTNQVVKPLTVSGYGVELALKRTDYIVIDDRETEQTPAVGGDAPAEGKLVEEEIADLRPLSYLELLRLDTKAASFVMASETPLDTLEKLLQDFPKHSSTIAAMNVSADFDKEHRENREVVLPPGFNALWINGVQIVGRDVDAFALLEHLRKERKMINSVRELGLTGASAIDLLSHEAITTAQVEQEATRYDWRDDHEGGGVVIWLNNIEKDTRYADFSDSVQDLLQRSFRGQMPSVRKDIHNVVIPVDFSTVADVRLVAESLQGFVKRGLPIRFGVVPVVSTTAALQQAKIVYHLVEAYGLAASLHYLQVYAMEAKSKLRGPSEPHYISAIQGRNLRGNHTEQLSLKQVLSSDRMESRVQSTQAYLERFASSDGSAAPILVNGVIIPKTDDWLQGMSEKLNTDVGIVQQAVFEGQVTDDSYIPDLFLYEAQSRRMPLIIPEDDKDLRHLSLGELPEFVDVPSIPAQPDTIERELVHMTVIADVGTTNGLNQLMEALLFQRQHDNVELAFIQNSDNADEVYAQMFESVVADLVGEKKLASGNVEKPFRRITAAVGLQADQTAITLNGRMVGPIARGTTLGQDALVGLYTYERKKRLLPASLAIQGVGLEDKATTPFAFAKISSLIALSQVSDVPEGFFEAAPSIRMSIFKKWQSEHTAIKVGDVDTATIQIYASVDPASELAQRWIPIIKALSQLDGVYTCLFLNPRDRLEELPIKRFYRHVIQSSPSFNEDGSLREQGATFAGLPADALLTTGMDLPASWLVAPEESVHDPDNIKLSALKSSSDVDTVYELEHILIEGHSRDVTAGPPPRGAQLVLETEADRHFADTIIMANLGYFQFKANPGVYNLALQKGRSEEIFHIDSAGTKGYSSQLGDDGTEIALMSFRGATLLSKAVKYGSSLLGDSGKAVASPAQADINIFSVASGHLYERMLNIMMVSVMKHTEHSVKFWFIEQFLSPSFKDFLPVMAEEYGFQYEMVTYKWPHWLRGQKEKQREIWGYKILFLDVLFPLDLDKVIFVDADQIVRTDMYELVQHDLEGAPYGFTPMCDSRVEMEGFRFWKQGYWKNYLRGLPYHISALYVVDLQRFRAIAAGDRLRQQYQMLSADPGSLSNLDQDLPNHMQMVLPIHSLPQEWLWCETWCSDESLRDAKTIDLCNNPLTKEPKLERARRQVPEWTVYDDEIAGVARKWKERSAEGRRIAKGDGPEGRVAGEDEQESIQERLQREDAERERRERQQQQHVRDEL